MSDDAPKGHIKLARKGFASDPFWLEHRVYSRWEAWVFVIQLACFSPYVHQTAQGSVPLERGEFVASHRWLGAQFKWNLKRVRYWLSSCEKGARIRAQRETPAGTVYLIVNYDIYQSLGHSEGTAEGTPKGAAGAQEGHKREAIKAKRETTHRSQSAIGVMAWSMYPKRAGSNPRSTAAKAWAARVREGVPEADMLTGTERYRSYCEARGIIGTEYVMQAARFFGPNREFEQEWTAPRQASADTRPRQLAATEMFIGGES